MVSLPGWYHTNNALRIDGEQDVLQVTTRSNTNNITMLCWARIVTSRAPNYAAILSVEAGPGHGTEWNELIVETDGVTLSVYDHVTGNVGNVGKMTIGKWYKVAISITTGAYSAYIGAEEGKLTKVTGTLANISFNDYQGIGATQFASTEWFNGRLSNVRIWNAVLTDAQIEAEFNSLTPVVTANLLGHWLPHTVTADTVLTAVTGADLIDGDGGGIPDYTIEAGPLIY